MKIRKLADAAIVAAMLLANVPELAPDMQPSDLLTPAVRQNAVVPSPDDTDDALR